MSDSAWTDVLPDALKLRRDDRGTVFRVGDWPRYLTVDPALLRHNRIRREPAWMIQRWPILYFVLGNGIGRYKRLGHPPDSKKWLYRRV